MFKTDILFTGFYGQSNTGDDAFVEVASWGAMRYWGKEKSRFLAKSNKLPKTVVPVKGYPITLPKTYGFQSELLLNSTDALVFAGGSTVHSKLDPTSIRWKAFKQKSEKGTLKIGGVGVSVGPFNSSEDERAVQSYLRQMDFLAVRDQASFDYVSSLELPFQPVNAFDLAALLPEIYNNPKTSSERPRTKKVIGVSVCPYESVQRNMDTANEERRNKMMIDLLKELDKLEDLHFKFYIINGKDSIGDRKLTLETIARSSPNSFEIVDYSSNTQSTWESISDCDFIISTRLHAAIFACFSNTPFVLNEYHRKCADFLQNVDYHNNYRMYDSDYNVLEKAKQICEIIGPGGNYIHPKNLELMKRRAEFNFSKISI